MLDKLFSSADAKVVAKNIEDEHDTFIKDYEKQRQRRPASEKTEKQKRLAQRVPSKPHNVARPEPVQRRPKRKDLSGSDVSIAQNNKRIKELMDENKALKLEITAYASKEKSYLAEKEELLSQAKAFELRKAEFEAREKEFKAKEATWEELNSLRPF